ncbi:MAG: hypothetical protein EZS28_055275, partial [Streblomastix strix]
MSLKVQFLQSLLQYASVAATNVVGIAAVHVVAHVVEVAAAKDVHIVNRTVDSSNSNYQQQHAAEEGQYYDKNNQQMQQRNGNEIVVVVADNAYIPQYGVQQQPYAAYQNPAYQYPQQNRPPLPPPLQNQ